MMTIACLPEALSSVYFKISPLGWSGGDQSNCITSSWASVTVAMGGAKPEGRA